MTGQTGDAVFDADADAGGLDARLELQLVFNELFDQLVIHDGILAALLATADDCGAASKRLALDQSPFSLVALSPGPA